MLLGLQSLESRVVIGDTSLRVVVGGWRLRDSTRELVEPAESLVESPDLSSGSTISPKS
jgi:hypothetical protein